MNVLIFSFHQFGLLVDPLKYCQYGREELSLTYLGWDYGKPKVTIPGVSVKYVSREGNIIQRNIRLLKELSKEVASGEYKVTFMHYTRGISFVRLINPGKKMIFDIRTLSVDQNPWKRKVFNFFLKLESLFFRNISVISEGAAKKMHLKKYYMLPLGADMVRLNRPERRESFHLLYVGTLAGRDILKCVHGMEKYIRKSGDTRLEFTIVGDGVEWEEIKSYVENSTILKGRVHCPGRIPHHELLPYFEKADAGVSFVPVTEWYNDQPPTKTFEYLLSGLPVIATRTFENEKVLRGDPYCVLIDDTADSFAEGLYKMKNILGENIDSAHFYTRYAQYTWSFIVKNYFIKMMKEIT